MVRLGSLDGLIDPNYLEYIVWHMGMRKNWVFNFMTENGKGRVSLVIRRSQLSFDHISKRLKIQDEDQPQFLKLNGEVLTSCAQMLKYGGNRRIPIIVRAREQGTKRKRKCLRSVNFFKQNRKMVVRRKIDTELLKEYVEVAEKIEEEKEDFFIGDFTF